MGSSSRDDDESCEAGVLLKLGHVKSSTLSGIKNLEAASRKSVIGRSRQKDEQEGNFLPHGTILSAVNVLPVDVHVEAEDICIIDKAASVGC